jgi:hypothetical protein
MQPFLWEGERPRQPKHLPTSGKSGLARTPSLPAEIALACPGRQGQGELHRQRSGASRKSEPFAGLALLMGKTNVL